jgi:chromosome partitioning protein
MAHETSDPRPRRRLFGRRRSEGHEPPPDEADVARNGDPVATLDASDHPETPAAVNPEPSPAESATEPSTTERGTEPAAPIGAPATDRAEAVMEQPDPTPPDTVDSSLEVRAEPEAGGPAPRPHGAVPVDETDGAPAGAGDEEEQPMVTTNPAVPAVDEAALDDTAAADTATAPASEGSEDVDGAVLPLPRVIAIANQKGGVGKTTTAVNLGAALAEAGYRVLVVDLDPQGNASTGLGISPRDVENSVYDVIMTDTPALDCVEPTSLKNLFVLPATIDLAGAEIELVAAFSRELKLRRALDPVRAEYDLILIDCPPSLGLLTVNGLAAADDVIVPVQSEYYALEGLGQLLKNVAMVRSVNPTLDVRGIVLTMHDSRTKLAEQVEVEVREHFGAKVYKTAVPRNVRLAEAPSFGQPIIAFDPASRGAWAYRDLAKEVTGGATRRTR